MDPADVKMDKQAELIHDIIVSPSALDGKKIPKRAHLSLHQFETVNDTGSGACG